MHFSFVKNRERGVCCKFGALFTKQCAQQPHIFVTVETKSSARHHYDSMEYEIVPSANRVRHFVAAHSNCAFSHLTRGLRILVC